jgi:hypothetical protein
MMATCSFAGITFWNDSATGRGAVQEVYSSAGWRTQLEALPGAAFIVKVAGRDPGAALVVCQYNMTDSEIDTLVGTTLPSLAENNGTLRTGSLTIPPGQTFSNVYLDGAPQVIRGTALSEGGTIKYPVTVFLRFQRLKG